MNRIGYRALLFLAAICLLATCAWSAPAVGADSTAPEEDITAVQLSAVNPHASREAKNLLAYLQTLNDTNSFITGTFDMATDSGVYNRIREQFGAEPGLYSARYVVDTGKKLLTVNSTATAADQLDDDVLAFTNVAQANAQLKQHYDQGNILLIHSDGVLRNICPQILLQNHPEEYPTGADGIRELDSTNPDRDLLTYAAWVRYQDNLIAALQQLEDSGVKAYLWRPWVEFNYHAFFGTGEEGKAAFTRVYRQTVERMQASGLTGFLVTYSPGAASATGDCYPGAAYIDVLSVTMYSENPSAIPGEGGTYVPTQFEDYSWFVKTGKPIGLSETSCRTGMWASITKDGRQSWYQALKSMQTNWPRVSWVNCWGDGAYSLLNETDGNTENGNDDGYWYLHSPFSINREALPDYRHQDMEKPGVVQLYTTANFGGNGDTLTGGWYGLEQRLYRYAELKELGLDPADIASFHINTGYALRCFSQDNGQGTVWSYLSGTADARQLLSAGKIRSLEVLAPQVVSHEADIYASDNDADAWKANDGAYTRWEGQTDDSGTGWLMLDLGATYAVNRWVVRHAGSVGIVSNYNTKDFALQYSLDGQNWLTADPVTNNRLSVTDRTLTTPVNARYFRLLITAPNAITQGADSRQMTIVEWQLYGLLTTQPASVPSQEESSFVEPDFTGDDDAEIDAPTDSDPSDEPQNSEPEKTTKRRRVTRTVTAQAFPWWGYAAIGCGIIAVAAVVVVVFLRRRKKAAHTAAGNAKQL